MRVFLKVAYDGTDYHGWQFQEGVNTIEGELKKALLDLLKSPVDIIGASRTDAGVHAMGNTAVFDTDSTIPADRYIYALNERLPMDIRIMESKEVSSLFHPRYNCIQKTYIYRIEDCQVLLPTKSRYVYHYKHPLDVGAMEEAARYLIGEHDFTSLASVHSQTDNFVRTIFSCSVLRHGREISITVSGSGFLYNMVRIIAGTLLKVGAGRLSPDDIPGILRAKDRTLAGATLPAHGLILRDMVFDREY